jgi:hypothetical protein
VIASLIAISLWDCLFMLRSLFGGLCSRPITSGKAYWTGFGLSMRNASVSSQIPVI